MIKNQGLLKSNWMGKTIIYGCFPVFCSDLSWP